MTVAMKIMKTVHPWQTLPALVLGWGAVSSGVLATETGVHVPPPAPPPIVSRTSPEVLPVSLGIRPASGATLYSIGQPTDEEQLHLEYINRARSNPPAEGVWLANLTDPDVLGAYTYFGVDLPMLVAQFSTNPPVPPLSMNSNLVAAARRHSLDMLDEVFQAHDGSDGSNPGSRTTDAGYPWNTYGENVYATAESVLYGHAGFNVDWGFGPGGMQSPPGHRNSILSGLFREIGIGVALGSKSKTNGTTVSTVGPQLVTQDFGSRSGLTPMITGVAYFDFNDNGFYDLGEGIGGLRVDVAGAAYRAVTANSGGYTVPVPGNGAQTVTLSASGQTVTQSVVTVSGGNNVKLDFRPDYRPPLVSGPPVPGVGTSNIYGFSAVLGATNYQWKVSPIATYTYLDRAASGATNLKFDVSSGYAVITNTVAHPGTLAYHLAHPAPPKPQVVEIKRLLRPTTNAQLRFASRLGWAMSDQVARVQISTNQGLTWVDLSAQPGRGNSDPGETAFQSRTNSLAAYAGWDARVRFVYDFASGTYFPQTDEGVGWYFDEITFSGVDEIHPSATNLVDAAYTFAFNPAATNRYELSVRALLPGRVLTFGPTLLVTAGLPPPSLSYERTTGNLRLHWPTNHPGFVLQSTATVTSTNSWANLPGTPSVGGTNYEMTVETGSGILFFRLRKP